MNKINKR